MSMPSLPPTTLPCPPYIHPTQEFYDMLSRDPARAFYGPGHVNAANELCAIGTLLLSDSLFR